MAALTNSQASRFSLKGKKGKETFSKSKFYSVILGECCYISNYFAVDVICLLYSIAFCFSFAATMAKITKNKLNKEEINNVISRWLALASQRSGGVKFVEYKAKSKNV